MRQKIVISAAMALVFGGMCILENSAVRARPIEPSEQRTSSIYALAGEFRTVFANLLWIKAEQYHHEYMLRDADWARNKELMGMLDLITALDPHFIEAYEVGTYIQKDAYNNKRRAMTYLLHAIDLNPKAWELDYLAAVLYVSWFHDPGNALPHALKSIEGCGDDEFYHKRGLRLVRTIRGLIAEPKGGVKASPTHPR